MEDKKDLYEYFEHMERGCLPPRTVTVRCGGSSKDVVEPNDGWKNESYDTRRGRRREKFREKIRRKRDYLS